MHSRETVHLLKHLSQKEKASLQKYFKELDQQQCKLAIVYSEHNRKKAAWFALHLALGVKEQFSSEVLLLDFYSQHLDVEEFNQHKNQYHLIVVNVPHYRSELHRQLFEMADFVLSLSSQKLPYSSSGQKFNIRLSHQEDKLNWQMGHYARVVMNKTVGIALSSGTALSAAHYGVLQELEKQGIPIDMIAGTSGGAGFGILFNLGFSQKLISSYLKHVNWIFLIVRFLTSFSFSKMGLLQFERLIRKAVPLLKGKTFKDMKYPMVVTTTNLNDGKTVYIEKGSVLEAMKLSTSIPLVFNPVIKNRKIYADGCLLEPVPVKALRQKGIDIVIAIDVTQRKAKAGRIKNFLDIYMQSNNLTNFRMGQSSLNNADYVLPINQNGSGYLEYSKFDYLTKKGKEQVRKKIRQIKKSFM